MTIVVSRLKATLDEHEITENMDSRPTFSEGECAPPTLSPSAYKEAFEADVRFLLEEVAPKTTDTWSPTHENDRKPVKMTREDAEEFLRYWYRQHPWAWDEGNIMDAQMQLQMAYNIWKKDKQWHLDPKEYPAEPDYLYED